MKMVIKYKGRDLPVPVRVLKIDNDGLVHGVCEFPKAIPAEFCESCKMTAGLDHLDIRHRSCYTPVFKIEDVTCEELLP